MLKVFRSSGLRQGPRTLVSNCTIFKNNSGGFDRNGASFVEIKSVGLHESTQLQLGTSEAPQHLLKDRGELRKPVSRYLVAGPSGCVRTSNQQPGKQTPMGDSLKFP
jgi:hypothetical protein